MNDKRRLLLKTAIAALKTAEQYVSAALDQEQYCLISVPENFEGSDSYEKMEAAIENLEDAVEEIDDTIQKIREASA